MEAAESEASSEGQFQPDADSQARQEVTGTNVESNLGAEETEVAEKSQPKTETKTKVEKDEDEVSPVAEISSKIAVGEIKSGKESTDIGKTEDSVDEPKEAENHPIEEFSTIEREANAVVKAIIKSITEIADAAADATRPESKTPRVETGEDSDVIGTETDVSNVEGEGLAEVTGQPTVVEETGDAILAEGDGDVMSPPEEFEVLPTPSRPEEFEVLPTPSRPEEFEPLPTPSRPEEFEALPTPSRPEEFEVLPIPSRPEEFEVLPTPSRPEEFEVLPIPSRPEEFEVLPTPSRPEEFEVLPTPSRPEEFVVLPISSRPEEFEVLPTPSRPEEFEVLPTPSRPEEFEVLPTPSRLEELEVLPTPSRPEEFEVLPTPSRPEEFKVLPTPSRPEEFEVLPTPSRPEEFEVVATSSHPEETDVVATPSCPEEFEVLPTPSRPEETDVVSLTGSDSDSSTTATTVGSCTAQCNSDVSSMGDAGGETTDSEPDEAFDIVMFTPQNSRELTFLDSALLAIARFDYDLAKDVMDKEREESSKQQASPAWMAMLSCLSQMDTAEKTYMSLTYLVTKGFFIRKDSPLKGSYRSLRDEFQKIEELGQAADPDSFDKLLAHLCGQLSHFATAREQLNDFYEYMCNQGSNKQLNYEELQAKITAISEEHSKNFHHPILVSVKSSFSYECDVLIKLMAAQVNMQKMEYFKSILSLQDCNSKLCAWDAMIQASKVRRTIPFTARQNQAPALYQWMWKMKDTLASKFTLFFYETLTKHGPAMDVKTKASQTSIDFHAKLVSFQKKTDAKHVLLVFDATGCEEFKGMDYKHPSRPTVPRKGLDNYPAIITLPAGDKPSTLWPSIVMIINERANELTVLERTVCFFDSASQVTYFLVSVDTRVTLVIIYDTKKSEKDSHITTFMNNFASQLKINKLLCALRPGTKP